MKLQLYISVIFKVYRMQELIMKKKLSNFVILQNSFKNFTKSLAIPEEINSNMKTITIQHSVPKYVIV